MPIWIEEWMRGVSLWQVFVSVAALVVVIRYTWSWMKSAIPQLKKAIQFLESLGKLPYFMEMSRQEASEQRALLNSVHHEVFPNGGGSMRDDLARVQRGLDSLSDRVDQYLILKGKDNG